uniref:Uncharacterized protein n=1 Tax=Wuchereria bancrofti TaxID=6293 RepID=A0A1I8EZR5_WUCBA
MIVFTKNKPRMSFPQNTSNAVLVDFLKKVGHIKDDRVMLSVDRADFCPQNSYQDCPPTDWIQCNY